MTELARPTGPRLDADRFYVLVALATVFALAVSTDVQSDTWWLLRTGEEIVETRRPVTTELWSSTVRGDHWPNHETLAEVGFYATYSLGGFPLLAAALASALTAAWYAVYRLCAGPPRVKAVVVLLAAYVQSTNYGLRPFLLTMTFTMLAAALLPHRRLHWCYPPLLLLWANTHGGVAFGGLLLAAACGVALLVQRDQLRHWLAVTAASALATLANPLGFGLWRLVAHTFGNRFLRMTNEWQPPRIGDPFGAPILAMVAIGAVAVALGLRRTWRSRDPEDLTYLLTAAVLLVLSLRAVRNSGVAAPFVAIVVARELAARLPTARTAGPASRVYALALPVVAALLLLIVVPAIPTAAGTRPFTDEVADAVRSCDAPLFTTFNDGGYLLWWVRDVEVFVDNRQDPYPQDLLFAAAEATFGDAHDQLFAAHGIGCAFIEIDVALAGRLRAEGWRTLAEDDEYLVLSSPSVVATGPSNEPIDP